jgi:uncharacterized protein (DUF927 family)
MLIEESFGLEDIKNLTKETILDREIFENIFLIDDQIARSTRIVKLQERARELGVIRSFDKLLKAYQADFIQKFKQRGSNIIKFTNSPLENLKCGKWDATDMGVTKTSMGPGMMPQTVIACPHPILPIERLVNVDTDMEKIKIAFYKDGRWQSITVDRSMVANKSNIVLLSDRGVEVTSDNAKDLVSYLAEIVSLNMKDIPVYRSIDRLGWVDKDFAPYLDDIKYDGDNAYRDLYECIKSKGDYQKWKEHVLEIRKGSKAAHLLLASSFASPLIQLLGINCFVVHLWGGTGTGKTVGLMLAMSVWGDPNIGKLVRTLNSTQVALARLASFLHDIPFAGDELQTIKNRWDSFDNLVMFLTEGIDRGRGKAFGGLEIQNTWNCIFLFTGEEPITKSNSGGGVKNRVIEIECQEKVVQDGNYTSNLLRENYGFAGKEFIENLPKQKELQEQYRSIFKEVLDKCDTTDKQAMAMATILLADKLSTDLIFKDGKYLEITDIKEYLNSNKEVDIATRAYEWTINWIAQNVNRFKEDCTIDRYGKVYEDRGFCFVNKNIYEEELNKNGFDYKAIIKKFAENGYIEKNSQGRYFHATKVNGIKALYTKIILKDLEREGEDEEIPF